MRCALSCIPSNSIGPRAIRGADGEFGQANYNLITPMNALGIVTEEGVAAALTEIEEKIAKVEEEINYEKGHLLAEWADGELDEAWHARPRSCEHDEAMDMTTTATAMHDACGPRGWQTGSGSSYGGN